VVVFVCAFYRIAFIDFDTEEAAERAMKKMNRKTLDGRQISIDYAETRDGGKIVFFSCVMYTICST